MQLKIKLIKSLIGRDPKHLRTMKALGLKKINQQVELLDTPNLQGMLRQVNYLVEVSRSNSQ